MTSRRAFLTTALKATAVGLVAPEWLLDPPKGRSIVAVAGPQVIEAQTYALGFSVRSKMLLDSEIPLPLANALQRAFLEACTDPPEMWQRFGL